MFGGAPPPLTKVVDPDMLVGSRTFFFGRSDQDPDPYSKEGQIKNLSKIDFFINIYWQIFSQRIGMLIILTFF